MKSGQQPWGPPWSLSLQANAWLILWHTIRHIWIKNNLGAAGLHWADNHQPYSQLLHILPEMHAEAKIFEFQRLHFPTISAGRGMAHSTPKDDHYSYTSTRCPPITWETGIEETKSAQSANNFNCSVLIPHVQLSHALTRLLVLLNFTQSNKDNSFLIGMVSMHLHQTKRSGEEAGVRSANNKQCRERRDPKFRLDDLRILPSDACQVSPDLWFHSPDTLQF